RKLEQAGAGESTTGRDLKRMLADIDHVLSLSAERAAADEGPWWERLGPRFPALVSRASRLLAMLSGREAAERSWEQLRDQVAAAADWWDGAEAQGLLEELRRLDQARWERFRSRPEEALAAARDALAAATGTWAELTLARPPLGRAGGAGTPVPPQTWAHSPGEGAAAVPDGRPGAAALLAADRLLCALERLSAARAELEAHLSEVRREVARLESRLTVLQRKIAQTLERLAATGLMDSEEYRKWSGWQQEAALLAVDPNADPERVSALERLVDQERPVVEAAVSARQDVDAALRLHLDALQRRQGAAGGWPPTSAWFGTADWGVGGYGGDMWAASWSALALAEAMAQADLWADAARADALRADAARADSGGWLQDPLWLGDWNGVQEVAGGGNWPGDDPGPDDEWSGDDWPADDPGAGDDWNL
ncbi:MAG: hypothetical protein K6T30_03860, partial [Alicyclobacillus sp.]|nr:hypothetical protein [Alicyclobacillus sp.]